MAWTVEYAWRCERHGWNTCPLTSSALRFTDEPCCPQAQPLASRSIATPDPAPTDAEPAMSGEPIHDELPVTSTRPDPGALVGA